MGIASSVYQPECPSVTIYMLYLRLAHNTILFRAKYYDFEERYIQGVEPFFLNPVYSRTIRTMQCTEHQETIKQT